MGLQVRLRHALGERLFDLPDRPAESPLIVGRAREAEVKIPSVSVASQHCALFVHDGTWVLQDTSGGATKVNGEAVHGPTPLFIGDVISVGSDATPATVEIEPAGVAQGRAGHPAEAQESDSVPTAPPAAVGRTAAAPVSANHASALKAALRSPGSGGRRAASPSFAPPQMQQPAVASNEQWSSPSGDGDSIEGWQQPSSSGGGEGEYAPVRRRGSRKKKTSSVVPVTIGIVVCLLIVVGTAVVVHKQMQPPPPPPPPPQREAPVKHPDNMFSAGISDGHAASPKEHPPAEVAAAVVKPPPVPAIRMPQAKEVDPDPSPTAATSPSASAESKAAPAEPADPHKEDKAWNDVEGATFSPDIGKAILKFDDYRLQHPGAFTRELDAYTDDAMERLWWKRIVMLCTKRDALSKEIRGKDKEIREETGAAFKKTLEGEKAAKQTELAKVQEHLVSEMGYTPEDAPDLDNKDAMTKLADERDSGKFGAWKVRTLRFIRTNHGATPWDGE